MSTHTEHHLIIDQITKIHGKKTTLDRVSFTAKANEITCLLGPNGAGKSTLFNIITGFDRPDSGNMFIGKESIISMSTRKRINIGMSYLPQQACIYRGLTISDNIMSVLEFFHKDKATRKEKLDQLLNDFQLTQIAHLLGSQVSGGQRRRTEIARCMATNPKIVLLDEPFAGIDPIAITQVKQLIFKLQQHGVGVLITDHQAQITLEFCNHAFIMYEGKILCNGAPNTILNHSEVKKLYLGEDLAL